MTTIANNKKAYFNYNIESTNICGISLAGTEVKSIRNGDVSIGEAYCYINDDKLYIKNMYIKKYEQGSYNNHEETRDRQLLVTKSELSKMKEMIEKYTYTVIPTKVQIIDGWIKVCIGIGKGKKLYDKRNALKERDLKNEVRNYLP